MNQSVTRISINFIVPSVNSFSCSNFDKLKLSENYLDNLDKIKNIIYYLDKKKSGDNSHPFSSFSTVFFLSISGFATIIAPPLSICTYAT